MTLSKRTKLVALSLVALAFATGAKMWHDTLSDPVVERTQIALPGLDPAQGPIRIALISDIHVAGPDMPPERLARTVEQINALEPDIVAIAGDMVSTKALATRIYTPEEIVTPLAGLTPRLATVIVPGNHDHWYDMPGFREQYRKHGMVLLENSAAKVGPLVLGGLDDDYTGRADLPATLAAMEKLKGARLVLSHSPDPFPELPDDITLMLAGHTHCGQVAWPWHGAPATSSRYGNRFVCGRIDEGEKTVVVGPGLGTSVLPFRLFTRPTIWVIELK